MKKLEKFAPHLYAIFGFIVIAIIYFYPVLSGKQIMQSDIAQYTGMAKKQTTLEMNFIKSRIGQIAHLVVCQRIN